MQSNRSIFDIPNSFQKPREKQKKKLTKKGNFYAKPNFEKIDIRYCCNSKINHRRNMKFSQNVYTDIFYT